MNDKLQYDSARGGKTEALLDLVVAHCLEHPKSYAVVVARRPQSEYFGRQVAEKLIESGPRTPAGAPRIGYRVVQNEVDFPNGRRIKFHYPTRDLARLAGLRSTDWVNLTAGPLNQDLDDMLEEQVKRGKLTVRLE